MQAILCERPGALSLIDRPAPSRSADEVLVRIRRVGVCGTDMHIFAGKHPYLDYPRVMGHELSGEVAEAPAGSRLRPGDPVYINPYISCGTCHACRRGKPNCCMAIGVLGVHRDGGMCELLAVPARNVFKAEGVSLDQAAMIEFLAVGRHAIRRAQIAPGDRVLVVGVGPIGLGAALFASLTGAEVTALDAQPGRLKFCRDALGLATVLAGPEAQAECAERTGGDLYDVVVDATGNAAAIEASFDFVAHGGTFTLLSVVKDRISFSDPDFHRREMRLVGSRNALAEDFADVLAALAAGQVPSAAMLTHRSPLAEVPAAFERWLLPAEGVIKAMVEV